MEGGYHRQKVREHIELVVFHNSIQLHHPRGNSLWCGTSERKKNKMVKNAFLVISANALYCTCTCALIFTTEIVEYLQKKLNLFVIMQFSHFTTQTYNKSHCHSHNDISILYAVYENRFKEFPHCDVSIRK